MNEVKNRAGEGYALRRIKGPQDFFGGLVLAGVALLTLWASRDLTGMSGSSLGPGTAPRIFGVILFLLGGAIALLGLFVEGERMQRFAWRGPTFVTLAIILFSLSIRPLGLVISSLLGFFIAALATPETNWKETIIAGVLLTIGCSLLFPYALGLPLDLFPRISR